MKFQQLGVRNSKFKPGGFTTLMQEVNSGKSVKDINRMTPNELARVPQIYGILDPAMYIPEDVEDDKIYKLKNGDEVLGSDIKAITMLLYTKARSAYTDFKGTNQIKERDVNGAVPLGLLGHKRANNISYSRWQKSIQPYLRVVKEERGSTIVYHVEPTKDESLEKVFKVDLLLGKTLASTEVDNDTGEIRWKKDLKSNYGLIVLSTFHQAAWRPNRKEVEFFREYGWGNYKGNIFTSFGTSRITKTTEDVENVDKDKVWLYNNCDTALRLMLAQRWAWFDKHRTEDMITDFQNWDNLLKAVDAPSNAFQGLKPKNDDTSSNLGVFGL